MAGPSSANNDDELAAFLASSPTGSEPDELSAFLDASTSVADTFKRTVALKPIGPPPAKPSLGLWLNSKIDPFLKPVREGSKTPAADIGLTEPIEGARQAVTGAAGLARGVAAPLQVDPVTGRPIGTRTPAADLANPAMLNSASDVLEGALRAESPAMVAGGVTAPLETAAALAAGYAGTKGGARVARAAGASPAGQRLAGNVAGFAAGAVGAGAAGAARAGLRRTLEPPVEPLEPTTVRPAPPIEATAPTDELGAFLEHETAPPATAPPFDPQAEIARMKAEQLEKVEQRPEGTAFNHDTGRVEPIDELSTFLQGADHAVQEPIADAGSVRGGVRPEDAGQREDLGARDAQPQDLTEPRAPGEAPAAADGEETDVPATDHAAVTHVSELEDDHLREVRRIVHELDAMGFNPRVLKPAEKGGGLEHVEGTGSAGAPVYHDIIEAQQQGASNISRGAMQQQLERFLAGGKVTSSVQGAIDIARLRLQEKWHIPGDGQRSGAMLPPSAGDVPTRLEPKEPAFGEAGDLDAATDAVGHEAAPVDELEQWFTDQAAAERQPPADDTAPPDEAVHILQDMHNRLEHPPQLAEAPFSLSSEVAKPNAPPQSDLFGQEKPTFGGRGRFALPEERGTTLQSTTIPGGQEFIDQDITPAVKEVARLGSGFVDDITRTFAPQTRSPEAADAAGIIRMRRAEEAHQVAKAERALSVHAKLFDTMPPAAKFQFIDDIERGRPSSDPALQPIQTALRTLLDSTRREVQSLGKLDSFIRDYFPHIWKDPKKAGDWLRSFYGRRPLEGSKSFLKKRSIPTTADGLAVGLVPVSDNPVTLSLLKVREMRKWIAAHRILEDAKAREVIGPDGNPQRAPITKYVPIGMRAPQDWVKIVDPIGTVYGDPNVPVHEAYDARVMAGLNKLAEDLGVKHERLVKLKDGPRGAWGLSFNGQSRIETRFGGPEAVVAHEIGHQIDEKYGLWNKLRELEKTHKAQGYDGDWSLARELRNVTDLSWEGRDPASVDPNFKKYVRQKEEKIANMVEAYVHAPDKFKTVAPNVFDVFDELVDQDPTLRQMREIKPSLVLGANTSTTRVGGLVVNGHWFAPREVADVLGNHLSPGLSGRAAYDAYRAVGNVVTQANFAFSTFHALFESVNSVLSKAALTLEYATPRRLGGAGDLKMAAKKGGEIVAAPIVDYFRGSQALKEYYTKDASGRNASAIVDQIIKGGGRVKWDDFYQTHAYDAFKQALRSGNYPGAMIRAPFALAEQTAKPIMQHLVPRLKLGAYLDLAQREMKSLPAGATAAEETAALGRAWDSVDNRFGELVHDNLFWKKYVKDMAQVLIRTVGWNVGTVRELGGAGVDTAKYAKALATGKTPTLTHRQAYALAMATIGVGFGGAMTQYLYTGKKPESVTDYFFPLDGGTDANGRPTRIKLPTYAADVYEFAQHPVDTVANKLSNTTTGFYQAATNRDYRGVQVRDPDASIARQAGQVAAFAGKQLEPISVSNMLRAVDAGKTPFEGLFGLGRAPSWIGKSKAETLIQEFTGSSDTRTLKQEEARQARTDLRRATRNGDQDGRAAAIDTGVLGRQSIRQTSRGAALSALQSGFKKLTADQALQVYDVATPEERAALRRLLALKRQGAFRNVAPNDREPLAAHFGKSMALPYADTKPAFGLQPAAR